MFIISVRFPNTCVCHSRGADSFTQNGRYLYNKHACISWSLPNTIMKRRGEWKREKYRPLLYIFFLLIIYFSSTCVSMRKIFFFLYSSDRLSPQIVVSLYIYIFSLLTLFFALFRFQIMRFFSLKWDNHWSISPKSHFYEISMTWWTVHINQHLSQ